MYLSPHLERCVEILGKKKEKKCSLKQLKIKLKLKVKLYHKRPIIKKGAILPKNHDNALQNVVTLTF